MSEQSQPFQWDSHTYTPIEDFDDAYEVSVEQHHDGRGNFFEAGVAEHIYKLTGEQVAQFNLSYSKRDVRRGMHIHRRQWDYWMVVSGQAHLWLQKPSTGESWMDVASRGHGLVIPPGYGHGFGSLTNNFCLMYAVTNRFDGTDEDGWHMSPSVGWIVSDRDRRAMSLPKWLAWQKVSLEAPWYR